MRMKKYLFVAVMAAMVFAVNAKAQLSVGVGYANERVTSKTSYDLGNDVKGYAWTKSHMQLDGFYVEADYNWEFAKVGPGTFTLQPGLRYTLLTSPVSGTKANFSTKVDVDAKCKYTEHARYTNHLLDIPVNVKYSYEFVPGTLKAYVFAGPVFSFGLAANNVDYTKLNMTVDGETTQSYEYEKYNSYSGKYTWKKYNQETKKIDTETGKDDAYKVYNAFDLKLGLGAGVTICEDVDIRFGYNFGLLNRSFIKNLNSEKYSAHSNIMYFGVAYNF